MCKWWRTSIVNTVIFVHILQRIPLWGLTSVFYKIFDISVAALRSIITPLYRYRIHKLMQVFLTEMVGSTIEMWMINLYYVKREEEWFSISFLWSINYDWWSVVSGRERSSQPLPAATGRVVPELSRWRGSVLLFLIGCECDGTNLSAFCAAGFLQCSFMNHCLDEYENNLSYFFQVIRKRERVLLWY